jgi:hypothetical protein
MATASLSVLDYAADRRADAMTIERLLQERVFDPEIIELMTGAYERARLALGLTSRSDAATALLAETVLAVVERGVRDAEQIFQHTMRALKNGGA